MSIVKKSAPKTYSKYEAGIGLIELLISMLIGLFIMAGVLQMFSTTSQNQVAAAGSSRIQENLRYAFARMSEDISQAGNLGCTNAALLSRNDQDESDVTNLLGVNSVPVAEKHLYDFHNIVFGISSNSGDYIGDAVADTDVVRLRYVSHSFRIPVMSIDVGNKFTVDVTDPDFTTLVAQGEGQILSVSDCSTGKGAIFVLTSVPDATGLITVGTGDTSKIYNTGTDLNLEFSLKTLSYLYGGQTGAYEYYIGTSAAATAASETCSATNEGGCALFRSTGKGTADEEILEGVHDLEVFYGATDVTGALTYAIAENVTDWNLVDRMRVTLSLNSVNAAETEGNSFNGLLKKDATRTFIFNNQL